MRFWTNSKDKENQNNTPLHLAASQNDSKLVQILVDRRARVGAVNDWGYSALRLAIEPRYSQPISLTTDNIDLSVIKILAKSGATAKLHESYDSEATAPTMFREYGTYNLNIIKCLVLVGNANLFEMDPLDGNTWTKQQVNRATERFNEWARSWLFYHTQWQESKTAGPGGQLRVFVQRAYGRSLLGVRTAATVSAFEAALSTAKSDSDFFTQLQAIQSNPEGRFARMIKYLTDRQQFVEPFSDKPYPVASPQRTFWWEQTKRIDITQSQIDKSLSNPSL